MLIKKWMIDAIHLIIIQMNNFVGETLTTFTANSYQLTVDLKQGAISSFFFILLYLYKCYLNNEIT